MPRARNFQDQPVDSESSQAHVLDLDQFLFDKRSKLEHFFDKVHEELSQDSVFALHFFLKFSKQLAKKGDGADEQSLDLLRKALKHVSKADLEVFLFYETELAVQIVTDLIENNAVAAGQTSAQESKPVRLNAIDREMRMLAQRLKGCPNYRLYSRSVVLH